MSSFIKQCKGKELHDVAPSKLLQDDWFGTIKYDGNYIQIHKTLTNVFFYTSGGKQFYFENIAQQLLELNLGVEFIIECEFIAHTDGTLGSRTKCSTGTYRANFKHGIKSTAEVLQHQFRAFDILKYNRNGKELDLRTMDPATRHDFIKQMSLGQFINPSAEFEDFASLEHCQRVAKNLVNEGWEGVYIKHRSHRNEPGKRVNTAIKLKYAKTATLTCIGYTPGEDSYTGMIGSLKLQDENGLIVNVNSGLNMDTRQLELYESKYKNSKIEIEYEQILDTYINAKIVCVVGE